MLKIWRESWRKEDSRRSQIGLDGNRGGQSRGAGNGTPPQDAAATAPPNSCSTPLIPVLSHAETHLKRANATINPETVESDESGRSAKRVKTEHPIAGRDSLGSRLPEVFEVHDIYPSSTSLLSGEVLNKIKSENTIAFLPADQVYPLISQFLIRAVQTGDSKPIARHHPTALVVVEDESTANKCHFELRARTNLHVKKDAELIDRPDTGKWLELLREDVAITTAVSFHSALTETAVAITHFHSVVIMGALNLRNQDSLLKFPIESIMNNFYRETDPFSRPRILALATRDSDYTTYSDSDVLNLERVFDAKILRMAAGWRTIPDFPSEVVMLYDRPMRSTEPKLFKQLHQLDPTESSFPRHFQAARYTLVEMGPCASDLVWRRALKQIEADIAPSCEDDGNSKGQSGVRSNTMRAKIRETVRNWVYAMPNLDSSSRGPYGEAFRGIMFVQRRVIALAVTDLLRNLGDHLDHIRPYAMTGFGQHVDDTQQEEIFRAFAAGTYNFLIATKSVEDLDFPKAAIIIRFDLFESQLSYAFARLRARGWESHVVHMVERGNDAHRRILSQLTLMDDKMRRWTDALCRTQGNSIPPLSLHETTNPYHSDSDDDSEDFIEDPTTSGRIYAQDAIYVVYRFAAALDNAQSEITGQPFFKFEDNRLENGSSHISCSIDLPGSPIHSISGSHGFSKALARRAACYRACLELHRKGFLDYRLFPLPSRALASGERLGLWENTSIGCHNDTNISPTVAESENKALVSCCYQIKKPDFWVNMLLAPVTSLYPTVIMIDHGDGTTSSHPYSPMLILTRLPLPELNTFKVFFSGVPADVRFIPCAEVKLTEKQLHDIHLYTIRVCRAIANKPFICSREDMTYFFAPLRPSWRETSRDQWNLPDISDYIPWDLVSLAVQSWATKLQEDDVEPLTKDVDDAVIQDRMVEFTRRYNAVRIRTDLTPLSKPVDSTREAGYKNLVEYCKARRKDFEGLRNYNQPLIEVAKVPAVLNNLNPTSRPVECLSKVPAKYLIPELCAKFTIPASTLRTALLLPSIMRRIDDFLLVKELNAKIFDHVISERLLHIAISAPSTGIEYDYERLELLGDAFLKYLSSIYVFVTNPAQNEGVLHVARQRIISNRALLHSAVRTGLPSYVQAKPFAVRLWQPPNFAVDTMPVRGSEDLVDTGGLQNINDAISGEDANPKMQSETVAIETQISLPRVAGSSDTAKDRLPKKRHKKRQDDQNTHWLGNKAVADVTEAIIGAAYLSGGRESALKVTKALNLPIPNIDRWSDFGRKALAPPPDVSAKLKAGSIEAVEAIIGHNFHRPHILAQALTHSSMQGYESTSYERLEFIGDAILDFMVIRYIFDRNRQLSPGGLTLLKGAMVSNSALAAVCVSSGLQKHLIHDSESLANSFETYSSQLKARQSEEYKQAAKDNRPPGQYWLDIEPPKALSDVIESIIGAIYISDNFSPVGAETLFDNVLKPFYDRHITLKTLSHHPTKILFELFQAQGCQQFQVTKEKERELTHCQIIVHDVVLADARDISVVFASRLASSFALDALEGDPEFLTRTCDCRTHSQTRKALNKNLFLNNFEDEDDMLRG